MSGIQLYTSNQLEQLTEQLVAMISREPLPPMESEIIAIPSGGMERYISFALAEKLSVCAHVSFPFPKALIQSIYKLIFPEMCDWSLYQREMMTWKIMELLPSLYNESSFSTLKSYLQSDVAQNRLFELSLKIADLFDQYLIFRPDMLLQWDQGKEKRGNNEQWQAILWRALVDSFEIRHQAQLQKDLFAKLSQRGSFTNLPSRISLFGISYLPPQYLRILDALAQHCSIYLFSINPCKHFWDDIISSKKLSKVSVKQATSIQQDLFLHYETGNRLLSSLGSYGKEYFSLLHDLDCEEESHHIDPRENSLLSTIQGNILNLYEQKSPKPIDLSDDSIQIHNCHNALREIEVLHDTILAQFDKDSSLAPHDIIVMSPDLDHYAPYVEAVFKTPSTAEAYVPYTIADTHTQNDSRVIQDFFELTTIGEKRFSATALFSLLESPIIQETLGIDQEELQRIRQWIEQTGIRWGIDGTHRKEIGLPEQHENTWYAGLDQLFLGFAMEPQKQELFKGIIPNISIDEGDTPLLEKLTWFIEKLIYFSKELETDRPLSAWSDLLLTFISTFLKGAQSSSQSIELLRKHILSLNEQGSAVSFSLPLSFSVIREFLQRGLSKKQYGSGFITGGVTFCTLLPMRNIPFKVVCLIGMNHATFPRKERSTSFNVMHSNPLIGDRSLRKEDRYCFLEALLSARQTFIIIYQGRNCSDNSIIQPATPVTELIDYIQKNFSIDSHTDASIVNHITWKHRLNAFSEEYFLPTSHKYFSYSKANFEATQKQSLAHTPQKITPISVPLESPVKTISLQQLCAFFFHPVKHFLKNQLGIFPPQITDSLRDEEPFTLEGLSSYTLNEFLISQRINDAPTKESYEYVKSLGMLPHGEAGRTLFQSSLQEADFFVSALQSSQPLQNVAIDKSVSLSIDDLSLTGNFSHITEQGPLLFRTGRIRAKDRIWLWLHHLIYCATTDGSCVSTFISKESSDSIKSVQFQRIDGATQYLRELITLYKAGMSLPLPFYPETSFAFARSHCKGNSAENSLRYAEQSWFGTDYLRGERNDPYYRIYPGKSIDYNDSFMEHAQVMFRPILQNAQESSL